MTAVISEFSSTILNPFDLQRLLDKLTSHAIALTGSQGAGVMLAGDREGKLGFAAASDERAIELELIQDRIEAGACYDAFLHNQLTVIEDLDGLGRGPAYEHRAAQSGVRAVLSVPMNAWGETIGVLSIYRDEPGPWSPHEIESAQIITSMSSGYVLHANRIRARHDRTDQLQGALEGRDLIGQAKGMLMVRDGLDADTAFDQLRTVSQNQNIRLFGVVWTARVGAYREDDHERGHPRSSGNPPHPLRSRPPDQLRRDQPVLHAPTLRSRSSLRRARLHPSARSTSARCSVASMTRRRARRVRRCDELEATAPAHRTVST